MTLPVEVVVRESGQLVGYACGECSRFHIAPAFLDAEGARLEALGNANRCCAPRACDTCQAPLGERRNLLCFPCEQKAREDRSRECFDAARKVDAAGYDGWVSWPDHGPNEGYFASVDDLLAYCADEGVEPPAYVWGCLELAFQINAHDVIENALEEHHEEAKYKISDESIGELQEFLVAWCAKQDVKSYYEDRSTAVIIKKG